MTLQHMAQRLRSPRGQDAEHSARDGYHAHVVKGEAEQRSPHPNDAHGCRALSQHSIQKIECVETVLSTRRVGAALMTQLIHGKTENDLEY